MTDELKPCPFCGCKPEVKELAVGEYEQIKIRCDSGLCPIHPSCFGNKKVMVSEWNAHADQVAVVITV